jgi:hypothetical protein
MYIQQTQNNQLHILYKKFCEAATFVKMLQHVREAQQ